MSLSLLPLPLLKLHQSAREAFKGKEILADLISFWRKHKHHLCLYSTLLLLRLLREVRDKEEIFIRLKRI